MSGLAPFLIVTPVYEDAEAAARLFKDLASEFGHRVYVIAVDDGSIRHPLDARVLSETGLQGCVIRLKRNLGHQRAIALGLSYAVEHMPDCNVVIMDSDGEDVPRMIHSLMSHFAQGAPDIVVAERRQRYESTVFKVFYWIYKKSFRLLSGRDISFGNHMALSPRAVKRLAIMSELWVHLAACVLNSRLPVVRQPLDRGTRYAGKSKMNFTSLVHHGFRGLMVFAEDVQVRVGIACCLIAAVSLAAAPIPFILKAMHMATPGWASVLSGVCLLLFIQAAIVALLMLLFTGLSRFAIASLDYKLFISEISYSSERSNEHFQSVQQPALT